MHVGAIPGEWIPVSRMRPIRLCFGASRWTQARHMLGICMDVVPGHAMGHPGRRCEVQHREKRVAVYFEAAARELMKCVQVEADADRRAAVSRRIDAYHRMAADARTDEPGERQERLIALSTDLKMIIVHTSQRGTDGPLLGVRRLSEHIDRVVHRAAAADRAVAGAASPANSAA
jgi:hypothetical protein